MEFDQIGHRNRHEQEVHNNRDEYKCWTCGAVFARLENMHRHRVVHQQEYSDELKCAVCEKTFGRKDSLTNHQRQVHGGVRYQCKICPTSFAQKYKLKKHSVKHSKLELSSNYKDRSGSENVKENPGNDSELELSSNDQESSGNNSELGLSSNDKASSGNENAKESSKNDNESTDATSSCNTQNAINPKESEIRRQWKNKSLPAHSASNSTNLSDTGQTSTNLVKCKACPWEGKSLRGHLSRSSNACKDMYDYQALTKDAEKKHKKQKLDWEHIHSKDRNKAKRQKRCSSKKTSKKDDHICAHCGKTFASKFSLTRHDAEAHSNTMIECPKCQKSFLPQILRYHLLSVHHDRNTPGLVECPYCTKKFCTLMSKERHIKEVHEGGRDFQCKICLKKFSRKEYLDRHKSDVHLKKKQFSCPNCPKTFTRRDNLKVHLSQAHLKKNKFSCPHCKNSFSRKCSLERHIFGAHLNQAEGKRWPCLECPEVFSRKDYLDKHMKRGKHSFYEYCEHCDKRIKFKSVNAIDSHFVRVRKLSFIDRCRGFSKDTCVEKLKGDENQLKEFEQGSTTCIHCNETVPNEDYEHWICQDFEDPEKSTCIKSLMKRTHITCWMCKERFEINDYFRKDGDKWELNLKKNGCHYSTLKNPSTCKAELKKDRTEYLKKCEYFDGIRDKRRKEILDRIPLEKKIDFRGYHILSCNM